LRKLLKLALGKDATRPAPFTAATIRASILADAVVAILILDRYPAAEMGLAPIKPAILLRDFFAPKIATAIGAMSARSQ
jgi:hypothetical protein